MKTQNLYSLYCGLSAIYDNSFKVCEDEICLKDNELISLNKLCNALRENGAPYELFNGYIVGYIIPQISKEFDLLRFSQNLVVNIELKGRLSDDIKQDKVVSQLKKNYYYLKFLEKELRLFTFVEDDGVYEYVCEKDQLVKVSVKTLIDALLSQTIYENIDMESLFKPSNYLISPFNKTENFIDGEYFLTNDQETVKKNILASIKDESCNFFCISASAGTGKTLLIYDVAKTLMQRGGNPVIIHGGMLNSGHYLLKQKYGWNIYSISRVDGWGEAELFGEKTIIILDEAQRIKEWQVRKIIAIAIEKNLPVIFSYDVRQYLLDGENRDLKEFLEQNYSEQKVYYKELTNKIRTNDNMASFITNLMHIGKSKKFFDYKNITIEYFSSLDQVKEYMDCLKNEHGWKTITYTNSGYRPDTIDDLASLSDVNAHAVIGQEFDKVAFVMDKNFYYDEKGKLNFEKSCYSLEGMLYQIVTRVVNKLKIVVLDNPKLYDKLLKIKHIKNDRKFNSKSN